MTIRNLEVMTREDINLAVIADTKAFLNTDPDPATFSTNSLVEILYPIKNANTPASLIARKMIFQALAKYADNELRQYAHRGEPKKNTRGFIVRPWLWQYPKKIVICPTCEREQLKDDLGE